MDDYFDMTDSATFCDSFDFESATYEPLDETSEIADWQLVDESAEDDTAARHVTAISPITCTFPPVP